jgi:Tol biopolymer transport system component
VGRRRRAGVSLALAGTLASRYFSAPAAAPELRVDVATPAGSDPLSFAISPDARRLVFVAVAEGQPQLWLRPLDSVTAQPLPGTGGASRPFWSPDSQSVGFFAGGKLKRVDVGGGLPQTLADAPTPRGGAWSSTGVILFAASSTGPLFRVPASGGEAVAVTRVDPRGGGHRFPQFVSETQFLFYASGVPEVSGVYLGSLAAPDSTRLTAADTAAAYLPPGWLLYVRQGTLVARRFDASRGELNDDPVTVADPVAYDPALFVGGFSTSAAGAIAYHVGVATRRQLAWFDRSGKPLGSLAPPDENALLNPNLSPDGRRAVVDRTVQGNTDVWLLDGTRMTRLTFDPEIEHIPVWSPDGTRVAFDGVRKAGVHDLFVKPSSGAGAAEPLLVSSQGKGVFDWSADGRFVLFTSQDPKTGFDLWVLPIEGDRTPSVFVNTGFDERQGQFSPDGRWVAYQSNESGRFEIYVRPFPRAAGQWQVSADGGTSPRWRRDGRELYFIAPDGNLMTASIVGQGDTFEAGTPAALFSTRIAGGGGGAGVFAPQYDVAPDGRFLINVVEESGAATPITLLLNWAPRKP